MRGTGTKQDTTIAERSVLLDLTRLVRRAGQRQTGVDRVEYAYLQECINRFPKSLYGLVRTGLGYLILDHTGCQAVLGKCQSENWGPIRGLAKFAYKLTPTQRSAQSFLRKIAIKRVRRSKLVNALERIPRNLTYINVGHSNLDQHTLRAIQSREGAQIWVLIHDVIPLEWPEFHDPARVKRFENMLRNIGQFADGLIYNSRDTQKRTRIILESWGVVDKREIVAHLGMTPTIAHISSVPEGFDTSRPSFLILGTIEPRKNHKFLLDLWNVMKSEKGDQTPALYICGSRGWDTVGLFETLDRHPLRNKDIFELSNLTDAEVSGIMKHSRGLLSPSYAEGFGLTPLEGIQGGIPVVCSDLDVYREFLGEVPVYCQVNDLDAWKQAIYDCSAPDASCGDFNDVRLPTWEKHFSSVFEQI